MEHTLISFLACTCIIEYWFLWRSSSRNKRMLKSLGVQSSDEALEHIELINQQIEEMRTTQAALADANVKMAHLYEEIESSKTEVEQKNSLLEQSTSELKHVNRKLEQNEIELERKVEERTLELSLNMKTLEATQEQLQKQHADIAKMAQISKRQNIILAELAGKSYSKDLPLEQVYQDITQKLTEGLSVDRASIWLYNHTRDAIQSVDVYEAKEQKDNTGLVLHHANYPHYFKALEQGETIAAVHAQSHPYTAEFTELYLKPLGITSMLDIPIRVNGNIVGVICNESYEPHTWTLEDENFAHSISSVISLVIETQEKQRIESALRESRERFELAIQGSQDGLWDWNIQSGDFYYSPRLQEILGYAEGELEHNIEAFLSVVHPEDAKNVKDTLYNYLTQEFDRYEIEFRIRRKDESVRWILARGSALFGEYGEAIRIIGFYSDITERKDSAQKELLNEKMATLGTLMAGIAHEINTPMGAIRASADNMTNLVNTLAHEMPSVTRALDEETSTLFTEMVNKAIEPKEQLSSREERQMRKVVLDSLEKENLNSEESKIISDSLVKIGIYNAEPYQKIIHHTHNQDIIKTIATIGKVYTAIDNIHLAVNKSHKMIMALKNYSNTRDFDKPVLTDLSKSIDMVLTLYQNAMKHGITIVKNYEVIPSIFCYEDEITQVWTNIIWNAVQAMKGNGTLTLSIQADTENLIIQIEDNGPGIPKEIQKKIFEPFFTTKAKGEGTGLGLDICKKIIAKHHGDLTVDSVPGKTVFKIQIPLHSPLQLVKEAMTAPATI